jgi:hypothetical protein
MTKAEKLLSMKSFAGNHAVAKTIAKIEAMTEEEFQVYQVEREKIMSNPAVQRTVSRLVGDLFKKIR